MLFAWLNHPAVRYVGVLTYTLYLVHLIVLLKLQSVFPSAASGRLIAAAITLVVSLTIAVTIHHLIEKPLARLRKRLHHRAPASSALPRSA